MATSVLSKQDYFKIHKFLDRIQSAHPEDFRHQVLASLANIFNFPLTTFWLAVIYDDMVDPVTLSLDSNFIDNVQEKYFQLDPFYPKNLPKNLVNKGIITINDFTTMEEYQKSLFYKDILNSHKMIQELVYVYKDNGKLLGASAFLRSSQDYKGFSIQEIAIIETCLKYVSKSLSNFLLLADLNFQKSLFESLSNNSYTGAFILTHDLKITYTNSSAVDYCQELLQCSLFENPVDRFVKEFLSNNSMWKYGLTTTFYSDNKKAFSVDIVRQIKRPEQPQYLVLIQPSHSEQDAQQNGKRELVENLTLREREVLSEVLKGRSNKEIATALFISIATVKSHLQSIFNKCDVSNRTSLFYKFNTRNFHI